MDNKLFELSHTRELSQRARMEECTELGICPFCWEHLSKWHDAPVIMRGTWWVITANDHPYPGANYHYLAIYKDHVPSIHDMKSGAGDEIYSLLSELCKTNDIPGATIFMRTGEMTYTGATVFHLHAHIISGASRAKVESPDEITNWLMIKAGYKTPQSQKKRPESTA